jgi:hypothetical protein
VQGELNLDLDELGRSSALVRIDLLQLEVLQQKRETADQAFGEEVRSDTQNEHVRTWFEISPDAPEDVREANRWVEFRVERIDNLSAADVTAMTGAERVVQATLHGQLRIHGHTVPKSARVELTFTFEGDTATGVRVRSLEPVSVGLEEYDVRPRSAFGTLAQRTLAALGEKVATAAPVTFDFRAAAHGALSSGERRRVLSARRGCPGGRGRRLDAPSGAPTRGSGARARGRAGSRCAAAGPPARC